MADPATLAMVGGQMAGSMFGDDGPAIGSDNKPTMGMSQLARMGGPLLGGAVGLASNALPLLLREVLLRKQLKRQRQEHKDLAAEVEAGRFGPGAAEMQRRTAAANEQLRQQMEMQRRAQERGTALGGSPADMARLQQASARAQAAAAQQAHNQRMQQARQEAMLEEASKRQQLADLDARREAFTSAALASLMQGVAQGAGVAGRQQAARRMGLDARLPPEYYDYMAQRERPNQG